LEQEDEKITVRLPNSKRGSPVLSNGHENTNEQTESKENTETKANSFENISTSSPNSILEKDSDSTRVSQVLKLLSNRKLNLATSENETKETTTEKPSAPIKSGISLETLNILSQIKAKKDAAMNNKSVVVENTKMQEEKEEPTQVSESTLNLIKLLKTKSSPVKTAESHSDILNGPSIRERFGELIRAEREFVLPVIYKRLLEVFECFDKTINYFVNRREPTFLRFILKSVEDTIRIRASETQLAQILYVLPNAYSLSWEKNDRFRGEFDLYVKFANDENGEGDRRTLTTQKIDERRAAFKDGLLRITKAHHAEFLKTLSEGERRKNYDEERCWNSKFKVHDCPAIPEGKMPARPHKENLKSVKEFLQHSETKDSRVRRIMEETVRAQEEKAAAAAAAAAESKPVVRQFRNISGLSDKLLSMVRAKEQALATEAQQRLQTQNTEKHTVMQQELKKVAETIKVYYVQRAVSSMFFVNVVDHIVRNCVGLVLGQGKIEFVLKILIIFLAEATKYVEELINLCPAWLSLQGINGNRILKVDKSANMQTVFENIEKGKANNN